MDIERELKLDDDDETSRGIAGLSSYTNGAFQRRNASGAVARGCTDLGGSQSRLVSNRLKVVEVAPAPEIQGQKLLAEPVTQRACPFYLHAVIESDVASESFALIQLDGEPEIIREGGIVRRGSTRFKVRRIARQKLVLRQGKQEVQCFLSNEESSQ